VGVFYHVNKVLIFRVWLKAILGEDGAIGLPATVRYEISIEQGFLDRVYGRKDFPKVVL
jgi:hypothetical protein